jgi:hypothetical protein
MVQDLKLAGLVDATCEAYLRAARQLAKYYMTSPDQLSEIQVEQYILYVRDELGIAALSVTTFWTFCASSRHLGSATMESGAS